MKKLAILILTIGLLLCLALLVNRCVQGEAPPDTTALHDGTAALTTSNDSTTTLTTSEDGITTPTTPGGDAITPTTSEDSITTSATPDGDTTTPATSDDNTGEPTHTHQYEQGVCKICGETDPNAAIDYDIFYFELQDDNTYSVLLRFGHDSITHVRIPAAYNGKPVTSIGDLAFANCSSLTGITIPNSVTSIGPSAFWGCRSLTSIVIPETVTSIGEAAFAYCDSLTSVTIPEAVTSIGEYAFGECSSLTSVTFRGTMAEWNAMDRGTSFTGRYTVHCTDGDIRK